MTFIINPINSAEIRQATPGAGRYFDLAIHTSLPTTPEGSWANPIAYADDGTDFLPPKLAEFNTSEQLQGFARNDNTYLESKNCGGEYLKIRPDKDGALHPEIAHGLSLEPTKWLVAAEKGALRYLKNGKLNNSLEILSQIKFYSDNVAKSVFVGMGGLAGFVSGYFYSSILQDGLPIKLRSEPPLIRFWLTLSPLVMSIAITTLACKLRSINFDDLGSKFKVEGFEKTAPIFAAAISAVLMLGLTFYSPPSDELLGLFVHAYIGLLILFDFIRTNGIQAWQQTTQYTRMAQDILQKNQDVLEPETIRSFLESPEGKRSFLKHLSKLTRRNLKKASSPDEKKQLTDTLKQIEAELRNNF